MGLNFIGLSQKPRGFRIGLPWTAEFIILFSDSSVKALIFEVFCLFDLYGFWVFHFFWGGGWDAVTICIHLKLWKGIKKQIIQTEEKCSYCCRLHAQPLTPYSIVCLPVAMFSGGLYAMSENHNPEK